MYNMLIDNRVETKLSDEEVEELVAAKQIYRCPAPHIIDSVSEDSVKAVYHTEFTGRLSIGKLNA